jgi:tRNA 5-methylaminomethyl-2-thiouridine biosynthesis bifunctional protein
MHHDVIIIGSGIAGSALAYSLRLQQKNILILESATLGNGASGNPRGMIQPFLSLGDSDMRQFFMAAYHYCQELLVEYPDSIISRGIIQFPRDDNDQRMQNAVRLSGFSAEDLMYLSPKEASDLLQMDIRSDALFWRRGAIIHPLQWAADLRGNANTQVNCKVTTLYQGENWQVKTTMDEILTAKEIYIATGHDMPLIAPWLPELPKIIRPRAGQISFVPAAVLPKLPYAISFGNYLIPPDSKHEQHVLGATYVHSDHARITENGHKKNLDSLRWLQKIMPDIPIKISAMALTGRAAVRATTRNHMPIYGQAAKNLFYLTGLGSRGLMSAPYAAAKLIIDSVGIKTPLC